MKLKSAMAVLLLAAASANAAPQEDFGIGLIVGEPTGLSLKYWLDDAVVRAEGDLDVRGTLGVSRDAPVGFQSMRLFFDLVTDATADQIAKLISLTERYCVVYQTLRTVPQITVTHSETPGRQSNPAD